MWRLKFPFTEQALRALLRDLSRYEPRDRSAIFLKVRRNPGPMVAATLVEEVARIPQDPGTMHSFAHALVETGKWTAARTQSGPPPTGSPTAADLCREALALLGRRVSEYALWTQDRDWDGVRELLEDIARTAPEALSSPAGQAALGAIRKGVAECLLVTLDSKRGYLGAESAFRLAHYLRCEEFHPTMEHLLANWSLVRSKLDSRARLRPDLLALSYALRTILESPCDEHGPGAARLLLEFSRDTEDPVRGERLTDLARKLLQRTDLSATVRIVLEGALAKPAASFK